MPLLISRSGIAAAAHVQRPVVSMWQSRPGSRGALAPFPSPVEGSDLFDLEEIIEWQARCGRGNNPSFAADAPLHALLAGGARGEHDAAVESLIALAAASDVDLLQSSSSDLLQAALAADPHDLHLLDEIRAAAGSAELRELAARQIEAAFGASGAIEAVAALRARAGTDRRWTVSDDAVALIRELCLGLVPAGPLVSDGGAHPGDIALRVAVGDVERSILWCPATEVAPDGDRSLRRRALAAGVLAEADRQAAVRVLQVPPRSTPRAGPPQMLRVIDDFVLSQGAGAVGVVLGPAGVLCDALADRQARLLRADVLRTGRLRAVVRLPQGLVVDRPRTELGLWVLGDADADAALADRLLVTGDVTSLDPAERGGVVTDLVAALAGVAQIRARAFVRCRPVRTAQLLAADGALVPREAVAASVPSRAAAASALTGAQRLRRRGADLGIGLASVREPMPGRSVTLGELVASGLARVLPGKRVSVAELPEGTVPVLGAAEVSGAAEASAAVGVDALLARGRYARGVTEPGDVVVISTPRPRAIVDADGGSLVAYPARIVRLLRGGSPHAVAAAVNALPDRAGSWQSWTVPEPAADAAAGLEAALQRLAERRRALQQELCELAELESDMIDGVTSGALVVSPMEKE